MKKEKITVTVTVSSTARGSWNGVNPVTRVAPAKKGRGAKYNRAKERRSWQ